MLKLGLVGFVKNCTNRVVFNRFVNHANNFIVLLGIGGGLKRSGDFHAAYLRKLKSKIDEARSEYLESIDEEHRVYLELPIDAEDDHISGGSKGAEHDNDIMDVDL